MTFQPLQQHSRPQINRALKAGTLTLKLGVFDHIVRGRGVPLVDYLLDTYRDCPAALYPSDVVDSMLKVEAPNIFRRYVRPQIMPKPGFDFPSVPLPASMAPLAFEMGLNLTVALKSCRFVTFHAGVVADADGAVMISAQSGGGKSTLTAALMEQGFRLLSDEFALVGLEKNLVHAYPRPVSLKGQSIALVRTLAGADTISAVIHDTPKGDIAYRRARAHDVAMAHQSATPRLIVFPTFVAGSKPLARALNPAEAIMKLIPSSINYALLGAPAYQALVALVSGAKAYAISYGSVADSVKLVQDLYADQRLAA